MKYHRGKMVMQEEELIKDLRELHTEPDLDTSDFEVRDFVYAFGSPLDALMYSRLFWPEFVEINEMVFLKGTIEDEDDRRRLAEAFEQNRRDRSETEQAFNLVEVPSDLFGKRMGDTTEEEDHWLAERLAEMWRSRLQLIYPNRQFVVEVLNPENTGGEVGVIFYQK
jgi:hypothetical protein